MSLKPDRLADHYWLYGPNRKPELSPIPPEPYETWSEDIAYISEP